MNRAIGAYVEVTPSGDGIRIWGLANGAVVNRKFTLEIDGKAVAAELFRKTNKPLTVTGLELDHVDDFHNVDRCVDWAVVWGERRKAAEAPALVKNGHHFNGNGAGCGRSIAEIEEIVRAGAPAGENRSDLFHAIVGHYVGVGWRPEQIFAHMQEFPDGMGGRYLEEGRLSREIVRSADKYGASDLPAFDAHGWVNGGNGVAKAPPRPEPADPAETQPDPPELPEPEPDDPAELLPDPPELPGQDDDPDLDDEYLRQPNPKLPPLYGHGDPDARPLKSWLVKHLIPAAGHGLLSGQWGAGKTFVAFDLAAAVGTGQPFLGHAVKRQCGVLLIAAEGADEVRLRLDAVVRAKCGGMARAPVRWYETAPVLLQKGAAETLIAMAKQADASLQAEFGLPVGLVIIDTIAACAGYTRSGEENDNAAGQALMNVLKAVAQAIGCFVLGVDHFGKNLEAGTRGAYAKESSGDVVLACLGNKELSGTVTNTRLAVRKHRGGRQGQEHPFVLREVETPEPDEDGEPVTTMVVDWRPAPPGGAHAEPDPWEACRRQDQRTAILRLKRVLYEVLAEQGVELPIPPDGPSVRMADQELVRERFYIGTPAEGTPEQKGNFRRQKFLRAMEWAEGQQLLGIHEIGETTYLRLVRPEQDEEPEA